MSLASRVLLACNTLVNNGNLAEDGSFHDMTMPMSTNPRPHVCMNARRNASRATMLRRQLHYSPTALSRVTHHHGRQSYGSCWMTRYDTKCLRYYVYQYDNNNTRFEVASKPLQVPTRVRQGSINPESSFCARRRPHQQRTGTAVGTKRDARLVSSALTKGTWE
jgi:hypothetical protein